MTTTTTDGLEENAVGGGAFGDEGAVEVGYIDLFQGVLDPARPFLPFVDIRNEQGRLLRAVDPETHGFGKLVPVRHEKRSDAQAFVQPDGPIRGERADFDVVQFDQLTPRPVLFQERLHARHGVDGDGTAADDFPAQVNQSGVVPDMSMRQEDPCKTRRLFVF